MCVFNTRVDNFKNLKKELKLETFELISYKIFKYVYGIELNYLKLKNMNIYAFMFHKSTKLVTYH